MSIIQTIRDRAWIIAAAIAVALIAFIVQDAFQGGGGMGLFGGGPETSIGKVDGKAIPAADFALKLKQYEDNMQRQGYPMNDQMRANIREQLWNQMVEEKLLEEDFEDLGLSISTTERGDILYGANPAPILRDQFTDSTGFFNAAAAYQAVQQLPKNSPRYNEFWGAYVPELEKMRLRQKYTDLLGKSAYVPKWMVEKANAEGSQRSNISFVSIPYSTIADSTIKVTDEDVKQYINKHSKQYQQENARGISYVTFDAGPTAADSLSLFTQVNALKDQFQQSNDPQTFMVTNGSETPFYEGFVQSSKMQMVYADTLRKLPDGQVFGPYIDFDKYVLAKKVQTINLPDTVECRHILINTRARDGSQIRTDSAAKQLIDSVVRALNAGTPFDTLVARVSEDEGSKKTGGKYTYSFAQFQEISKEFAETIFYSKTGDKKTVFVNNPRDYAGYHYIEVLKQKNIEPGYKIAYLSRTIAPSNQTVNAANGLASQFMANSRDYKSFEANAKKNNYNVFNALDIKPQESEITGLGASRELVKWAFKAKRGDVSETTFMVDNKYVVPVLTHIYEKGLMDVEKARPLVEYIIRNEKKAEQIIKKIGNANTLEAVAQATQQQVGRADSLAFNSEYIPNMGAERKVVGAAFNPAFKDKISTPIIGTLGVFVIKVENIYAVANPGVDVAAQRKSMEQQQERAVMGVIQAMKKSAKIKDNRDVFY
jgi:peptidyl-prolyl cis-trans isomerase D